MQASVDFRNISATSAAILLNPHAIEINQDPLGQMGLRLEPSKMAAVQHWSRRLANGDLAVVLLNRHGGVAPCPAFDVNNSGTLFYPVLISKR